VINPPARSYPKEIEMDTKALIGERVKCYEDAKVILDRAAREGRTMTAAEQQTFDRLHARIDEIRCTVDRGDLQEAETRWLSTSRGRKAGLGVVEGTYDSDAALAFRAWACGPAGATDEMRAAADRLGLNIHAAELETRALSSVTATQGQASIPDEMMKAFSETLKWYGRVREVSTVYNTTTGAPLPIPTVDDTSNTGEIVADGGAITTTADPTFGVVTLGAFKYSSKAVIVPWELLQDSSINLPIYLGGALGTRIGRKQNNDFTVGAGTTLPFGVQVQASLGKTAAATNAITWDEVIDLYHAVDPAYRNKPNSGFMMADSTAQFLRKLKDSQNRYLWEMSLQVGQPDRAFGQPVFINNDQDSAFSTNKRLVLYGDFSQYTIRDAGRVQIYRADELRILNGQVVFLAIQRSDGNLVQTSAVKYLRTA
jgi:HK97 family phage major capsid protein